MKVTHFSLLVVTMFIVSSSSSCEKGEKSPAPDLSKGYPDAFANKMSPKKIARLKKAGMTIYEGQDPPALDGIFRAVLKVVQDTGDPKEVGNSIIGYTDFQFSKFDRKQKACLTDWTEWDDKDGSLVQSSEGVGIYHPIAGSGLNFSIDGTEQITDAVTGEVYDEYSACSGTITATGIRNWQYCLYE